MMATPDPAAIKSDAGRETGITMQGQHARQSIIPGGSADSFAIH
jgi:hypothetical protein